MISLDYPSFIKLSYFLSFGSFSIKFYFILI